MHQKDFYRRIHGVKFIGTDGLKRLQSKTVAMIGLGNLGSQAAHHLAHLGISLILVDRGLVEKSNLATQSYQADDLGKPKPEALKRRLGAINPECQISPVFGDLKSLGSAALQEANLYLCCLDNLPDRLTLNERALHLATPWIDAALDGTGQLLYGKVCVFDPRAEESPCYLCSWDQETLQAALRLERSRAEGRPGENEGCPNWDLRLRREELIPPTLSIPSLGGIIAGFQTILAMQLLLEEPPVEEMAGLEIIIDLTSRPYSIRECRLLRSRQCLSDHTPHDRLVCLGKSLDSLTLDEVFLEAERELGPKVLLYLPERELITTIYCPGCRATKTLNRVTDGIREDTSFCSCGERMRVSGRHILNRLSREEAVSFSERNCFELGLPAKDVITATNGGEKIHFILP